MSKEINLPSGNYLFVEVDEDCKPKQIAHNIVNKPNSLVFNYSVDLISTTKDITEEQVKSITEKTFCKCRYSSFMNSSHPCKKECKHPATAKESLQSLLQANSLDINKNYLILKRL